MCNPRQRASPTGCQPGGIRLRLNLKRSNSISRISIASASCEKVRSLKLLRLRYGMKWSLRSSGETSTIYVKFRSTGEAMPTAPPKHHQNTTAGIALHCPPIHRAHSHHRSALRSGECESMLMSHDAMAAPERARFSLCYCYDHRVGQWRRFRLPNSAMKRFMPS